MRAINLQLFGGRGSSSGIASGSKTGGGLSTVNAPARTLESLLKGKFIEGNPDGVEQEAARFLNSAQNVFDAFGIDGFTGVRFSEKDTLTEASVNGFDQLTIHKKSLGDKYTGGYSVNDTVEGTGAHEAGHVVVNHLIKNAVMPDATNLQKATVRHDKKLEKSIIREAKKRFGSNPVISGYGSKNPAEKVAEAFSDVFSNGGNANPYSQTIVDVCRDINNGTFKPKINY